MARRWSSSAGCGCRPDVLVGLLRRHRSRRRPRRRGRALGEPLAGWLVDQRPALAPHRPPAAPPPEPGRRRAAGAGRAAGAARPVDRTARRHRRVDRHGLGRRFARGRPTGRCWSTSWPGCGPTRAAPSPSARRHRSARAATGRRPGAERDLARLRSSRRSPSRRHGWPMLERAGRRMATDRRDARPAPARRAAVRRRARRARRRATTGPARRTGALSPWAVVTYLLGGALADGTVDHAEVRRASAG